jgi:hypothetical protein
MPFGEHSLALYPPSSRFTAVAGWAVRLELHVRRFFCHNQECQRQIFTERLPEVVASYARRTARLADLLTLIGFADGEAKRDATWWNGWG